VTGSTGSDVAGAVVGGGVCGWLVAARVGGEGFVADEFADCAATGPSDAIRRQSIAAKTKPPVARKPPTLIALSIAV
jgi:hypothetical protein